VASMFEDVYAVVVPSSSLSSYMHAFVIEYKVDE
jgi:hypothetical protein